jgi:hypothetical protein
MGQRSYVLTIVLYITMSLLNEKCWICRICSASRAIGTILEGIAIACGLHPSSQKHLYWVYMRVPRCAWYLYSPKVDQSGRVLTK